MNAWTNTLKSRQRSSAIIQRREKHIRKKIKWFKCVNLFIVLVAIFMVKFKYIYISNNIYVLLTILLHIHYIHFEYSYGNSENYYIDRKLLLAQLSHYYSLLSGTIDIDQNKNNNRNNIIYSSRLQSHRLVYDR